jgi:hypothetical protein
MAVLFPALPRTVEPVWRVIDNNGNLSPITGAGAAQRILRPGRFSLSAQVPALRPDCADTWLAASLAHITEGGTIRMPVPLTRTVTLPAGAMVDGAGQTGALLAIKGLATGQVIKPFTPFSFISGGVSYLHRTTGEATADGDGKAVVSIGPFMRVSPADGLALNFPAPIIEGDLDAGGLEWTEHRLTAIGFSFTITEK